MDSMTYENYNAKFFCYFNNSTANNNFNSSGIIFSFIFGSASVSQIVITNGEKSILEVGIMMRTGKTGQE